MTLTIDDVRELAQLCKLKLDEDESAKMLLELNQILGYVEKLQTVDLTGLKPVAQVTGLKNVMRADIIVDIGSERDELLKNVPSTKDGYIQVKRVL